MCDEMRRCFSFEKGFGTQSVTQNSVAEGSLRRSEKVTSGMAFHYKNTFD
jgi:hypothetical protein